MKNMTFRKQLTIFVFCTVVLTGCVLLGFLIDRSITANNLFGKIIGILAPFIAGGIIAFILKPLCNLLAKPIGKLFIKKVFRRSLERGSTTERRVLKRADNVSIFLSVLIFFLILMMNDFKNLSPKWLYIPNFILLFKLLFLLLLVDYFHYFISII